MDRNKVVIFLSSSPCTRWQHCAAHLTPPLEVSLGGPGIESVFFPPSMHCDWEVLTKLWEPVEIKKKVFLESRFSWRGKRKSKTFFSLYISSCFSASLSYTHTRWKFCQKWTTVTAGRIIVSAYVVRMYVHPHFSNLAKQKQQKTMFDTGVTMGLAEWIIDDTCLVYFYLHVFDTGHKNECFFWMYLQ